MDTGTFNLAQPVKFGVIGAGWRAEFYFRIAAALPECFRVAGMFTRSAEKRAALREKWGFSVFDSAEDLAGQANLDFVIVSVPWTASPGIHLLLHRLGIPALAETPPAPDLPALIELYEQTNGGEKIQVAEQYSFQPLHAARLSIARSGLLGEVSQAQVSVAHGYHGVSLIRRFLGVAFEDAAICAREFRSPLIASPDARGEPPAEERVTSHQTLAQLDFDGRLGVFDFTGDQYFSWIRSPRLLVRGEKGEINNREVRYLRDHHTPIQYELRRVNAGEDGNLEGYYLKGILAGCDWVYRNPFAPGRLTDDEIAIATSLAKMAAFTRGGPVFYSLAEAAQDHYLNLLIEQAARSGEVVRSQPQVWTQR